MLNTLHFCWKHRDCRITGVGNGTSQSPVSSANLFYMFFLVIGHGASRTVVQCGRFAFMPLLGTCALYPEGWAAPHLIIMYLTVLECFKCQRVKDKEIAETKIAKSWRVRAMVY